MTELESKKQTVLVTLTERRGAYAKGEKSGHVEKTRKKPCTERTQSLENCSWARVGFRSGKRGGIMGGLENKRSEEIDKQKGRSWKGVIMILRERVRKKGEEKGKPSSIRKKPSR